MPGRVFFVGAGPGDPSLITCRGRECLESAEAVLYDYLAAEELLDWTPPGCERICLGAHGRTRIWPLSEITQKLIELTSAGKQVVRLQGGDPTIFGRLGEELSDLIEAGIAFEIVPGVTAALGAAAYADVALTHRQWASAVALVTGQESRDKTQEPLDYRALAKFPGTLAIYMGVTSVDRWSQALIEGGKSADTPVLVIRRSTWPDQQTHQCHLGQLADSVKQWNLRPPVVFLIGEASRVAEGGGWFQGRPLFGQTTLVTRPRHQAESLQSALRASGSRALIHPVIEIGDPTDWESVDSAIDRLSSYDWLVFSSSNGVNFFMRRIWEKGLDLRAIGNAKIAAIGSSTLLELRQHQLRANLIPGEFRAEALAEMLIEQATGKRFLLVRASRGRDLLADELKQAGKDVDQAVVYESRDVTEADPDILEAMSQGEIEWVTVTSSAIANAIAALFGSALKQTKLASISPVTSHTLRSLGFEPAAEATTFTMQGLVAAMVDVQTGNSSS